jgi:ribose transport system permease protein
MTSPASRWSAPRVALPTQQSPRVDLGRHAGLIAFLGLEAAFFAATTPGFLTPENLLNMGRALAILAVVAIGATFGLISGALDISIGSVIALGGTTATQVDHAGWPVAIAILVAVGVGLGVGLVNGLTVVKLRVNPIVATLAMLGIARGVALIIDGGTGVVNADTTTSVEFNLMQRDFAGIPLPLILAAATMLIGHVVLAHTRFGRYAYAVGGSPRAGRAVALPVDRLRIAFLVLSGMLAGLGGWIFASMVGGVGANIAQGYELTAITAVIVGGVGLGGGRGSMFGTLLGVLILSVMVNGMTLSGVPVFYQLMGQGLVLLGAVALDARRSGGYR